MVDIGIEAKVQSLRDHFLGGKESVPYDSVAPGGLVVVILMIVVDGQVRVVVDFDIGDGVVVEVVLVDLLTDDVEAHVVALLDHDLHLV